MPACGGSVRARWKVLRVDPEAATDVQKRSDPLQRHVTVGAPAQPRLKDVA